MNYFLRVWFVPFGIFATLGGCVSQPVVESPPRMCSKPIGTAYVEEQSTLDKIAMQNQYPRQEIERLLMQTNCFKLVEGGPSKNDPMLVAREIMSRNKSKPDGPRSDYRISTSVVFAETGGNAGYSPLAIYGSRYDSYRAEKQNGKATIKLIDEKNDSVIAIATGEGVYKDTQWSSLGPTTNRSTNRVIELAYKNAIDNLVGQIDHMARR